MSQKNPVYHHRIPQTYMRPWCFSNNSIWTFDKATKKSEPRNIENICGVNHFHSIKAGSLYTNDDALQKIFGDIANYKVMLNGQSLDTFEERNQHFYEFDSWEIFYPKGKPINKKDRNVIFQRLSQTADTSIEEKWSTEFENDWGKISQQLYDTLKEIQQKKDIALTGYAAEIIMKYFVMFDWRGKFGNQTVNDTLNLLVTEIMKIGDIEIPPENRVYAFEHTVTDEMSHALLLRAFDGFLSNKGMMYDTYQIYCQKLTFVFLFSEHKKFITSDNPCFTFINKNELKEPIFPVLPNLLISLAKKDPTKPNSYKLASLTDEQVDEYNEAIFQNGDVILSQDILVV
jgi:hypothetical protein